MAADDLDGVLVDIDGDADAELLAGEAALAGLPVALGEVGVADVGLVDPDGVAHHDPVPVTGHHGERAVPPVSVNIFFTIFTNVFSPIAPTRMRRIRLRGCAAFGV